MNDPRQCAAALRASRELIASGEHDACPCVNTACQWHGNCRQCVMIHRVKRHHLPQCLQPALREALQPLAALAEMQLADARPSNGLIQQALRLLDEEDGKSPPR